MNTLGIMEVRCACVLRWLHSHFYAVWLGWCSRAKAKWHVWCN